MADHMLAPCDNCPFRRDVTPFLRAERGEQLAYSTDNPYTSFTCHKTLVDDDDGVALVVGQKSLECAGHLSMQINAGGSCPDGFQVSNLVYGDSFDMIEAYREEAEHL